MKPRLRPFLLLYAGPCMCETCAIRYWKVVWDFDETWFRIHLSLN